MDVNEAAGWVAGKDATQERDVRQRTVGALENACCLAWLGDLGAAARLLTRGESPADAAVYGWSPSDDSAHRQPITDALGGLSRPR